MSTEVLVCVQGPDDARQALAITPDGATRSRGLDLAADEYDGHLVEFTSTGLRGLG